MAMYPCALTALALAACVSESAPVRWLPPESGALPHPSEVRGSIADLSPGMPGRTPCGSFVEAALGERRWRARWWITPSGAGALAVEMSLDSGRTWARPVAADSADASDRGCDRPMPAIFADSASGYLHLSYFAEPWGAPGVYYAHSMRAAALSSSGEGMFHTPVAAMYGDKASRSAVASRGDTVVVAYEDPSSLRARVAIAFSATSGHSFSWRGPVSPGHAGAQRPRVALAAGEVSVGWTETAADGAVREVVRRGGLQ